MCYHNSILGELSVAYWEKTLLGSLCLLPFRLCPLPFPFADFDLCSSTVTSHSCKYNYMMNSLSPPPEDGLGGPNSVCLMFPYDYIQAVHSWLEHHRKGFFHSGSYQEAHNINQSLEMLTQIILSC